MKIYKVASLVIGVLMVAGCGNTSQPADALSGEVTTTPVSTTTQTSEQTPTPAPEQTPTPPTTYTMSQVQAANTPEKCWSAINGKVYDLTAWINKHPGGDRAILSICGKDGSSAFNGKHGGQMRPEQVLAGFEIGTLK